MQIAIPAGLQTRVCVLGDDVLKDVPAILRQYWPGRTAKIVADENTWAAAGQAVQDILTAAGMATEAAHIYPAQPMLHADYRHVEELKPILRALVPIAVGSGTINDLVKCASHEAATGSYLCVATAPSVDGYTSSGAALLVDGFKKTVACDAPLAILADNAVVSQAPMPMVAAGYADLAAKIVAGADWHIADALGITPRDPVAWDLVQKDLRQWLANPQGILDRQAEAMAGLFLGLAATGFAMQYYQESRPASGAEHLFSHIWEMDEIEMDGEAPSHGFKVAIGTLLSTALMEESFALSAEEMAALAAAASGPTVQQRRAQVDDLLGGSSFHAGAIEVATGKLLVGNALQERRQRILAVWPLLQQRVREQLIPFGELRGRFALLGCPVEPAGIGLDEAELRKGVLGAAMIRNRYTILDLLFELGQLEAMLDKVIAKGYFRDWRS
jgi:glycerol-1-phosphate dehydrogenase [NAD(P)+]